MFDDFWPSGVLSKRITSQPRARNSLIVVLRFAFSLLMIIALFALSLAMMLLVLVLSLLVIRFLLVLSLLIMSFPLDSILLRMFIVPPSIFELIEVALESISV